MLQQTLKISEENALILIVINEIQDVARSQGKTPPPNRPWLISIQTISRVLGPAFTPRLIGQRLKKMKFDRRMLARRMVVMIDKDLDLMDKYLAPPGWGTIWDSDVAPWILDRAEAFDMIYQEAFRTESSAPSMQEMMTRVRAELARGKGSRCS